MPIQYAPPIYISSSGSGVSGEGVGAFFPVDGGGAPVVEPLGTAIALVVLAGVKTFVPCGAVSVSGYPACFLGFLHNSSNPLNPVIYTLRGATITPRLEGGVPLVPRSDVYLSATPGFVTCTPPTAVGQVVLRVGFAVDATTMILNTDLRIEG